MTQNMAEARREDDPAGPQSQCDEHTPKSTGHVGHTPTGGMLAAALELDLATLTEERLRQLHASRAAAFTAEHTYQARGRWRGALHTMSDAWAAEFADSNADGYCSGALTGYTAGVTDTWEIAFEIGRRQGAHDAADLWDEQHSAYLDAENRALVSALTSRPDHATLCELRGEPDRAQRARALLRERGIA